jgi:hypothetical protein
LKSTKKKEERRKKDKTEMDIWLDGQRNYFVDGWMAHGECLGRNSESGEA